MAAVRAFLGACAVMVLMTPTPIHSDCQLLLYHDNGIKDLKCSNMSIDKDSPKEQTLVYAIIGLFNYIDRLFIQDVNFVEVPDSEWFKDIDYFEVRRNNENMSKYVISKFKKISVFNVSESATAKVFKGLHSTSYSSHLSIIFENLNINQVQSICHDSNSNYPPWSLSLRHNRITNFTKYAVTSKKCASKLKYFDLKYNNLTSFDADVFVALKALESIDLSYNQIVTFHDSIVDFPNHAFKLVEFYLDNNYISELQGNTFKHFGNLKLLTLDSNNLSHIDITTFNNLDKMEQLSLSNNKINSLDPRVFSGLISLTKLNLSGNCLVRFAAQNFHPIFNSLRYINLDGNQWEWDELKGLIDYLSRREVNYTTSVNSIETVINIDGIHSHKETEYKNKSENISERISQSRGKCNEVTTQSNLKNNEHIWNTTNIGYIVLLIILIIVVTSCIGVIVVKVRRSKTQRRVTEETTCVENREMTTMREEELHYDYVEVRGINQRQDNDSCTYEEPKYDSLY